MGAPKDSKASGFKTLKAFFASGSKKSPPSSSVSTFEPNNSGLSIPGTPFPGRSMLEPFAPSATIVLIICSLIKLYILHLTLTSPSTSSKIGKTCAVSPCSLIHQNASSPFKISQSQNAKIFALLPVTLCTAERFFSSMKLLKK